MKTTKLRVAAAGLSALGLVAGATAATAAAGAKDPSSTAACERVTGLTFVLDAFQSGGAAGPGVVYGVVVTAVGAAFPAGSPLADAQSQVLAAGASGVEQIAISGPDGIKQLKAATAMLAQYNEYANKAAELGPTGFAALADTGGESIAPFDLTLRQMADISRATIEPDC